MKLIESILNNDLKGVLEAIEDGKDPSMDDNHPIRLASEYGFTEIVKELLKYERVDPSSRNNYSIRAAACYGHINTIKILMAYTKVDIDEIINSLFLSDKTGVIDNLRQAKMELRNDVIDSIF